MKNIINIDILEKIISFLVTGSVNGDFLKIQSQPSLEKIITAARKTLFSKTDYRSTTTKEILTHLLNASIISVIEFDFNRERKTYYYLGSKEEQNNIQPAELLASIYRKGILCFFAAFEVYELTSQLSPYYHIAQQIHIKDRKKEFGETEQTRKADTPKTKNPLGTKEVIYNNIPYYLTKRDEKNIIGIREIDISGNKVGIVSLEQCLIDCFLYDKKSGGINIITEVWENAGNYINAESIINILNKINSSTLNRKIGFFLDYINKNESSTLNGYLNSCKDIRGVPIQLLSNSTFNNLNNKWNILVP